jgi:DNA-binding response OmpR family regulator
MILLVASPGPNRRKLELFLAKCRLPFTVCDTFEDGIEYHRETPGLDLMLAEYEVGGLLLHPLIERLSHYGWLTPLIVIGAPMGAEAELLRAGALWNVASGYSPMSVALMCRSVRAWTRQLRAAQGKGGEARSREFLFGDGTVSEDGMELRGPGKPDRRTGISGPTGGRAPDHRSGLQGTRLTRLQLRLLRALRKSPGRVLDYEFLSHEVWRRPFFGRNAAMRELVSSLRKKFECAGMDLGRWVTTVHGKGYRYDPMRKST